MTDNATPKGTPGQNVRLIREASEADLQRIGITRYSKVRRFRTCGHRGTMGDVGVGYCAECLLKQLKQ
jgi:hypothetical protein